MTHTIQVHRLIFDHSAPRELHYNLHGYILVHTRHYSYMPHQSHRYYCSKYRKWTCSINLQLLVKERIDGSLKHSNSIKCVRLIVLPHLCLRISSWIECVFFFSFVFPPLSNIWSPLTTILHRRDSCIETILYESNYWVT